jgi:outer membrane protein TolC
MSSVLVRWLLVAHLIGGAALASGQNEDPGSVQAPEALPGGETAPGAGPADRIVRSVKDPNLRAILEDVLERNPAVAAARAKARAATARIAQAGALPDPNAGLTAYLMTPETRVGPQRLMAMLSQRLPWFGKLALREKAAALAAAAAEAEVEAVRLEVLTEGRRTYYEIGFLDALTRVTQTDLETLRHYEELARSRYEAGVGLQQGVIKLQAEITRDETKLMKIAENRAAMVAALNALRETRQDGEIPEVSLRPQREVELEDEALRRRSLEHHPTLAAADAEIARASTGVDLARREYKPDLTVALNYGVVGDRDDPAGRASPPPDNGQDVLGLQATVNVPIWRSKLEAGVVEATEERRRQEERRRLAVTRLDRSLIELTSRIPLLLGQLGLFEDVLSIQAEESLNSAESAYSSGSINALDLLDAERVLLEVRVGTARTLADYAIRLAELEATVAGPVPQEDRVKEPRQ